MKKCPYCAEEIQNDAIVCKHCGRNLVASVPVVPVAAPKKKRGLGIIAIGIILLVVVCLIGVAIVSQSPKNTPVLVATSTSQSQSTMVATAATTTIPTAVTAPEATATTVAALVPTLQVYKIGDVIQIGDLTMTVNSVSFPSTTTSFTPSVGNKFIAVDVTFQNTGTKSDSLSSLMEMSLKDDTGQAYTVDLGASVATGSKTPDGEIAAGEKIRGVIGYQVPKTAKGFQFVFDASLFTSGKVFVDLGQ